jgi:hypothetical protein
VKIGALRFVRRFQVVPRFYFHLFNDMTCVDEEGINLPNDAVAVQRTATMAREMAAESVRQGHLVLDHRIEVTNELGHTIGTVRFRDVIEVRQSEASD